jgi:hypothetical protein
MWYRSKIRCVLWPVDPIATRSEIRARIMLRMAVHPGGRRFDPGQLHQRDQGHAWPFQPCNNFILTVALGQRELILEAICLGTPFAASLAGGWGDE